MSSEKKSVLKELEVNAESLRSMVPTKRFTEGMNGVRDISCSPNGEEIILSTEDDVILVYNMDQGTKIRTVESKKYGVGLVNHIGDNHCLHSSTKRDEAIRHLSLSDTKYARYYNGHTQMVTGIEYNHKRNTFFSSALDNTVRQWDPRSEKCLGYLNTKVKPLVCIDNDGIVLAIATNDETIKLYDVRSYDTGAFDTFKIKKLPETNYEWGHIDFTPNGAYIIVSTFGPLIRVIDSRSGAVKFDFDKHENSESIPLRCTVTPDSGFLIVGSSNRQIYIYSLTKGTLEFTLQSSHVDAPYLMKFSEKNFCLVTVCREMLLWRPSEEYTDQHK